MAPSNSGIDQKQLAIQFQSMMPSGLAEKLSSKRRKKPFLPVGGEALTPAQLLQNDLLQALKTRPDLHRIPLQMLSFNFFGAMSCEFSEFPTILQDAVQTQATEQSAGVIICFAVRRAGCSSCREHGEQLTELAARQKGVGLFGIVKDRGDDSSLLDFHSRHFTFPVYLDEEWNVYKAMGGRKLTPKKILTGYLASRKRHGYKKIENTLPTSKTDGWMLGGLLLFDQWGKLRYAVEEEYGKELDLVDIQSAIDAIRTQDDLQGQVAPNRR